MSRQFILRRVVLVAIAGALALSGCGSKYTYVKSKQEQVFFKIPKEWESAQVRPDPIRGLEDPPADWRVQFAAQGYDPELVSLLQTVPNGEARVFNLTRAQAASISPATMRAWLLTQLDIEEDPLEMALRQDPRIDLLDYEELNSNSNLRGLRISYTWKGSDDRSLWFSVTQIGLLNETNTKFYLFRIHCRVDCFLSQMFNDDIKVVADSWTVSTRKG